MIRVQGLTKRYGGTAALRDVSFQIEKGERVAIIGPSGAGKSLLLRCLNGLDRPDAGTVEIGGVSILEGGPPARAALLKTGMVFQQFNLFSHLTAIDNIVLSPIRVLGLSKKEAFDRGEALLSLVGLPDKRNAFPAELSGGQQQRVAIARALCMNPEILLFDEPTSALDPETAAEVLALIRQIAAEADRTLLLVTHELSLLRETARRVFFLAEGTLYEEGSPEALLFHPQQPKTRAFLRQLLEDRDAYSH